MLKNILLVALLFPAVCLGDANLEWLFDQGKNVATVTTKQVMHEKFPVLSVVHFKDDHSWAFTCGTTNKNSDLMLVSMEQVISTDPTLVTIADLPPGWSAFRESINHEWVRSKDE